jgi:Uma2 family endonuclease
MSEIDLLLPLKKSSRLPKLLEEINWYWEDEQRRRKEFYETITPSVKAEWVDGTMIMHSPVVLLHNIINQNLMMIFKNHLVKNNIQGILGIEKLLCRFTRNDYEPDLCYFSPEKASTFTNQQNVFPVPDFVVEILSSSTQKNDRGVKFTDYQDHGVREYWMIDPETRSVEQYVLRENQYELRLNAQKGLISCEVLKGLEIAVETLFEK